MGLGNNIQPTPAVALGAYEMTPIDVAAGYTPFATNGVRAEPLFIRSVLDASGKVEETGTPKTRPVLDPRVAYLVTSLMEDVLNRGTGASVRAMGFTGSAAGKTGTARDGWFAGFTQNLLCVIWVGFDDNRDLGLSGSQAAAPMWAEFMKRAVLVPGYRNTQDFEPPQGVIEEAVDPQTGQLATNLCPQSEQTYFVAGTEPTQYCDLHSGNAHAGGSTPVSWLAHLFGKPNQPAPPVASAPGSSGTLGAAPNSPNGPSNASNKPRGQSQPGDPPEPEKKKGVIDKIFGIFGGSKKQPADNKPQDQKQKP